MSGFLVTDDFLAHLTDEDRRRLLAFATAPARDAFMRRFRSEDEKRAHFSALGRRSGAARRARANAEAVTNGAA